MRDEDQQTNVLPEPFGNLPRVGMGCWAIGGQFYAGDAYLGWAGNDDSESRAALEASWEAGVRIFDTADVYGAGHSETLVGEFFKGREDAVIVSKFGNSFDEQTKQVLGPNTDPGYPTKAVQASLRRLNRDHIDVLLLHLNDLPIEKAAPLFDELDGLRDAGMIRTYGWSTDFTNRVDAFAPRDGFVAVENASNVLIATPSMNKTAEAHNIAQLIRSPLAMGLLSGKYSKGERIAQNDVRNFSAAWNDWFTDRAASPHHMENIAAVRELLMTGGRTLAQGALCWLLAQNSQTIPVPGAKNAAQAQENAGAIEFGPLDSDTLDEIEKILDRPPEDAQRQR